ncbi:hypothetical protein BDV12DRAFT_162467 [Aspergillus spectabilis]
MFVRPPLGRPFPRRRENNQPPHNQQLDGEQVEDHFYPGIYDVLKVRHILLWNVMAQGIPTEVVDMIVDAAEYWPSTETTLREKKTVRKDVDQALISTSPLCYDEKTLDMPNPRPLPHRAIHPCRKIVFTIMSHDQGGLSERRVSGSERPAYYDGTYTWFDAEIIHNAHESAQREDISGKMDPTDRSPKHYGPDDPLLLPRGNALQRNRARIQRAKRHTIVWHHLDNIADSSPEAEDIERYEGRGRETLSGKQVREMELGDSILVWARARFPGWVNYVDELSVRVFWAI